MRRTLTHQIRQEVNVIFAKLRDRRLLRPKSFVPMISSIHHLLQDAALSMQPIRW